MKTATFKVVLELDDDADVAYIRLDSSVLRGAPHGGLSALIRDDSGNVLGAVDFAEGGTGSAISIELLNASTRLPPAWTSRLHEQR